MSGPLLTAAMIVRDEERHLAACLDSVRQVVDEIVVVDTGSVDRSMDIAASFEARVASRRWTGDFAAARNHALDLAKGRWVLYIDADERLRPVSRARVEALLDDAEEVAFRVLLRPFAHATPYREYRLWRNDPRIRFVGAMHEKVVPAIHRVAAQDGRPIGVCELALDHVGYDGDQTAKHLRNLPLLRAQLAVEPGNVFNWCHLARVLSALGQTDDAERALERAVQNVRPPFEDSGGSMAYADLVRLRHERGDDVRSLLGEGLSRYPDNWLLIWVSARLDIDEGRYERALESLDRLLSVAPESLPDSGLAYDERIFGTFAHDSRGLCLLRLGRYSEAADAYAAAARSDPQSQEHRVKQQLAEARAAAAVTGGQTLHEDGAQPAP